MSTPNADKLIGGKATDMNEVLRRRPPTAEAEAAEAESAPEAEDAPPSFDGGARSGPPAATDMNRIIRRQLYGRG